MSIDTSWIEYSKWRIGRTLGRTIYAEIGPDPSKQDFFLGIFDSKEVASYLVRMQNSRGLCIVCKKPVYMISWKEQGICSILCEKIRNGELSFKEALELGLKIDSNE